MTHVFISKEREWRFRLYLLYQKSENSLRGLGRLASARLSLARCCQVWRRCQAPGKAGLRAGPALPPVQVRFRYGKREKGHWIGNRRCPPCPSCGGLCVGTRAAAIAENSQPWIWTAFFKPAWCKAMKAQLCEVVLEASVLLLCILTLIWFWRWI